MPSLSTPSLARPFALLLLVAGCTSPVQTCLNDVSQNLTRIDREIAETRTLIERGTTASEPRVTAGFGCCVGGNVRACASTETPLAATEPRAVDRRALVERLARLTAERKRAEEIQSAQIAACQSRSRSGL